MTTRPDPYFAAAASRSGNSSPLLPWLRLLAWVLVGMLPALTTAWLAPGPWYAELKKPLWAPSAWMFEPIWMAVGLMMGIAGWLLARQPPSLPRAQTLVTYVIQVTLSAVWPPVFFGARRLDMALVMSLLLWFAIMVLTARAWWVQRAAALLLVPYFAWVTFVVALSGALFLMNR